MISTKLEQLINEQINHELQAAYLYLSMSSYFEDAGYKGFANWYMVQYKEETDHAMYFYKYLQNIGAKVTLTGIAQPETNFSSIMDVLKRTLEHEQKVTAYINNLAAVARDESNFATSQFLLWFIAEQVEEETNSDDNIKRLTLAGDHGLFLMDQELGMRTYAAATNPPVIL